MFFFKLHSVYYFFSGKTVLTSTIFNTCKTVINYFPSFQDRKIFFVLKFFWQFVKKCNISKKEWSWKSNNKVSICFLTILTACKFIYVHFILWWKTISLFDTRSLEIQTLSTSDIYPYLKKIIFSFFLGTHGCISWCLWMIPYLMELKLHTMLVVRYHSVEIFRYVYFHL